MRKAGGASRPHGSRGRCNSGTQGTQEDLESVEETPFQFRYQGRIAGPRTDEPLQHPPVVEAVARARGQWSRWTGVWLGALGVGLVAGVVWWTGRPSIQFPRLDAVATESQPGPSFLAPSTPSFSLPAANSSLESEDFLGVKAAAKPARRPAPLRKISPATARTKPSPPRALALSPVKISGAEDRLLPAIRASIKPAEKALQACCDDALRRQPALKGNIAMKIAARHGQITEFSAESPIRDPQLSMCFRRALISLPVQGDAGTAAFDARLDFFLTPRR